jgi:predicted short-subunit dehydrogenase-like oxidoreductase (DUF2520 family)
MQTVSIIGVGRTGGALALALAKNGYQVENLVARDFQKAARIAELTGCASDILAAGEFSGISSDIVFITTQDTGIAEVSKGLAAALRYGPFVFHTSGSLSSEVLSDLRVAGCRTGSIHPLVSISDAEIGAGRFAGAYFCIEGDAAAVGQAEEIVAAFGGKPFTIETRFKTLYHAAAVTAAGHITALLDASFEIMTKCGLDRVEARNILLPLVKSTVENLEVQEPSEALTGTFARADLETFERHVAALKSNVSEDILEIYLQLGLRSLHLAERQGVEIGRVEALREKVLMAKKDVR